MNKKSARMFDSIERVLLVIEKRETISAKARAWASRANWETGFHKKPIWRQIINRTERV